MPSGRGQTVEIVGAVAGGGAATTVSEQALEPVCAVGVEESVTNTVKLAAPAAVGVPVKAPAVESARPAGSAPALIV